MTNSAFDDKTHKPKDAELAEVLGRSHNHWNELKAHLAVEFDPLAEKWMFQKLWFLQLKRKKRTVLYLTPNRKHFVAGFALGEKAVKAAHEGDLPASALETIDNATKYAEGRAVRLDVRTKKDVAVVKTIAAIKMAN